MNNRVICHCGGQRGPHEVSTGGCFRKIAPPHLIPTDFRVENGMDVCTVNGTTISTFTLYQQRLYGSIGGSVWTMPKDESSVISIGENW